MEDVYQMGFWFFRLSTVLLIPIIMIFFGLVFSKGAPKKINYIFGYRTKRSMMNLETWRFAHRYIGRLWVIFGLVLLLLSVIAMAFVFAKGSNTVDTVANVLSAVQMIPLLGTIIPTEKALKKHFDEYGRKR